MRTNGNVGGVGTNGKQKSERGQNVKTDEEEEDNAADEDDNGGGGRGGDDVGGY
jgi:hypothetical protein